MPIKISFLRKSLTVNVEILIFYKFLTSQHEVTTTSLQLQTTFILAKRADWRHSNVIRHMLEPGRGAWNLFVFILCTDLRVKSSCFWIKIIDTTSHVCFCWGSMQYLLLFYCIYGYDQFFVRSYFVNLLLDYNCAAVWF